MTSAFASTWAASCDNEGVGGAVSTVMFVFDLSVLFGFLSEGVCYLSLNYLLSSSSFYLKV